VKAQIIRFRAASPASRVTTHGAHIGGDARLGTCRVPIKRVADAGCWIDSGSNSRAAAE
jgi:hypothetical protein